MPRNHAPTTPAPEKTYKYLKPGMVRRPGAKVKTQKVLRFIHKPNTHIPPYGARFEITPAVIRQVNDGDLVPTTKAAYEAGVKVAQEKAAKAAAAPKKAEDEAKAAEKEVLDKALSEEEKAEKAAAEEAEKKEAADAKAAAALAAANQDDESKGSGGSEGNKESDKPKGRRS